MSARDAEDHINWLLQHGWHEKALEAVEAGQGRSELLDEVSCLASFKPNLIIWRLKLVHDFYHTRFYVKPVTIKVTGKVMILSVSKKTDCVTMTNIL